MNLQRVIRQCLRKDERAYQKLFDKYMPIFAGVCRRYIRSSDELDDVLQEAFVKIFDHLHQLKDTTSFEAWGKRIVVNTALQTIRKNKNFEANESVDELEERLSNEEEQESAQLMEDMEMSELVKLMDLLPEGYRTIINLYAIEEMSHKDIAEMLGIQEATSRSQYFKAKKAYQKIVLEKAKHLIA